LAAAGALLLSGMTAQAAVIDFDALDSTSGQPVPLSAFSEDGFSFGLSFTGSNDGPVIFDTTCTGYGGLDGCNGDADLQPVGGQGTNGIFRNVLALQENNSNVVPNDDSGAATITFELLAGKAFRLLGFSAVDDGTFGISTVADGILGTINNGSGASNDGRTGSATFTSSLLRVGDTFTLSYSSSGGVDSIVTAPVPVPAAMPLSLAGLAMLGWMARRRRRS
jgi:hypothetical protein